MAPNKRGARKSAVSRKGDSGFSVRDFYNLFLAESERKPRAQKLSAEEFDLFSLFNAEAEKTPRKRKPAKKKAAPKKPAARKPKRKAPARVTEKGPYPILGNREAVTFEKKIPMRYGQPQQKKFAEALDRLFDVAGEKYGLTGDGFAGGASFVLSSEDKKDGTPKFERQPHYAQTTLQRELGNARRKALEYIRYLGEGKRHRIIAEHYYRMFLKSVFVVVYSAPGGFESGRKQKRKAKRTKAQRH